MCFKHYIAWQWYDFVLFFLTQKGKQLSSETAGKIIDAENRILADWGPETSEQYLALNERYLKCLQKELQRMKAEK